MDDENPEAIGPCKILGQYVGEYSAVIPTIGNQMLRMRWIGELTQAGFILPELIHPKDDIIQRENWLWYSGLCTSRHRRWSKHWKGLYYFQRSRC
ncbi:hypothetical protein [Oscillibacter sp. 1-3]|uniref:hypothetical protein n=1 Tax=Oscillibacter sp. 1-3 TaxID=1235797 RepID=UPI001A99D48D|nr:hypothetical protein [Oscillibacter sp. 1-3]